VPVGEYGLTGLVGQVAVRVLGEPGAALRDAEVVGVAKMRHLRGGECRAETMRDAVNGLKPFIGFLASRSSSGAAISAELEWAG